MKKQFNGDYLYSRSIRIIIDRKQVPDLFDEPLQETLGKSLRCTGTIEGMPARVTYSEDFRYRVCVQKPEHLDRVYNAVINQLLGIHPNDNGSRGLAEILGIKQ